MKEKYEFKQRLIDYYIWLPFAGLMLFPLLAYYFYAYEKRVVETSLVIGILLPFVTLFCLSIPFLLSTSKFPPYLRVEQNIYP